jgi:hypothetical protein
MLLQEALAYCPAVRFMAYVTNAASFRNPQNNSNRQAEVRIPVNQVVMTCLTLAALRHDSQNQATACAPQSQGGKGIMACGPVIVN